MDQEHSRPPTVDGPLDLIVAESPIDGYPQELALRFACPTVSEAYRDWTFMHEPDDEIAADLSALLTLFTRRLVLVAVKVRELYAPRRLRFGDLPLPVQRSAFVHWPQTPASVITPEMASGECECGRSFAPTSRFR